MQLYIDKLGKVAITVEEGYWSIEKDYDKLTVVEKQGIFGTYISRKPVPAGTELTNRKYWIPFSSLKEEIVIDYNAFINRYKQILEEYGEKLDDHEARIQIIENIRELILRLIEESKNTLANANTAVSTANIVLNRANKALDTASLALNKAEEVREEAQAAADLATEASETANNLVIKANETLDKANKASEIANAAAQNSQNTLEKVESYLRLVDELKDTVEHSNQLVIEQGERVAAALQEVIELKEDIENRIAKMNEGITTINNTLTIFNNQIAEIIQDTEVHKAAIENLSNNKVDKIPGKQLSTEDFTTALKTKLEGLNNYNDTELQEKIDTLTTNFNTLLNANPSAAINSFNEIIAFLDNIEDTSTLEGIISGINTSITAIQNELQNYKAEVTNNLEDITDSISELQTNLENKVSEIHDIFVWPEQTFTINNSEDLTNIKHSVDYTNTWTLPGLLNGFEYNKLNRIPVKIKNNSNSVIVQTYIDIYVDASNETPVYTIYSSKGITDINPNLIYSIGSYQEFETYKLLQITVKTIDQYYTVNNILNNSIILQTPSSIDLKDTNIVGKRTLTLSTNADPDIIFKNDVLNIVQVTIRSVANAFTEIVHDMRLAVYVDNEGTYGKRLWLLNNKGVLDCNPNLNFTLYIRHIADKTYRMELEINSNKTIVESITDTELNNILI